MVQMGGRAGCSVSGGAVARGQSELDPFHEATATDDGGGVFWGAIHSGRRVDCVRVRLCFGCCGTPARPSAADGVDEPGASQRGGGNEEEEAQKKYKEKEKEKSWLRWLAGWLEGWRLTGEGRRTVGREKGGRTKDLPVDYLLAGEAQLRSGPLTAQLGPRFDGRPRAPPRAALRERQCRESRAGQPSMRLQRFATVAEPKTAASQSSNYLRGEGLRAGAWTACLGAGVDRY